jgi:TetR/AcrR family transcriptional repressor of nem operon
MAREDTRARIIAEGARIVHLKGFNSAGVQEILHAAGVPRGSFYFYFRSKEEFGLALIDYYMEYFLGRMDAHFNSSGSSPLATLRAFFDEKLEDFRDAQFQGGCPIGNLAQEMGDLNEAFQAKLCEALDKIRERIVLCLSLAHQHHEIDPALDPEETADFILNSWEGALMRMKVARDNKPLLVFDHMVFERLLGQ